jgi:predicted DNA-binding transcriptional regulator AlpA
MATPPELLSIKMIRQHFVPLGTRTLYRMIATGDFPTADISRGAKIRLWRRTTIEAWIEQNAR